MENIKYFLVIKRTSDRVWQDFFLFSFLWEENFLNAKNPSCLPVYKLLYFFFLFLINLLCTSYMPDKAGKIICLFVTCVSSSRIVRCLWRFIALNLRYDQSRHLVLV